MSILKIALQDIEKIDLINTKGMTANQVYSKYKPDFIINGALYDMATRKNIVNVEDENVKDGYLFSSQGIGINGLKHLLWTNYETAKKDSDIRDFIGGSPCLVKGGAVHIDWGNKHSSQVDGSKYRSCIGFNATHFFMVGSDSPNTLKGLAEYCIKQGMKYAVNLDGGGSCHLQQGTKKLKSSCRANASWILVYLKKTKNKEEEEVLDKVKVKVGTKEQEGFIKDGVTYVPVRFVGENLGANVAWDGENKTVTVMPKEG